MRRIAMDTWKTGIPRIINGCKEYGLPDLIFEEVGDGFMVTLFRNKSSKGSRVCENYKRYGNDLESSIIQFINNKPEKI